MQFDSVDYEIKGTTALITLNEPDKLNALSSGIRSGLITALTTADDDPAVRVIIITGAGEKSFCAGADISGFEFNSTYIREFMSKVIDVLALRKM